LQAVLAQVEMRLYLVAVDGLVAVAVLVVTEPLLHLASDHLLL
jgi:hypothetical protein